MFHPVFTSCTRLLYVIIKLSSFHLLRSDSRSLNCCKPNQVTTAVSKHCFAMIQWGASPYSPTTTLCDQGCGMTTAFGQPVACCPSPGSVGHPELCRRPCMHLDCIAGSLGLGEKNMLSRYTWLLWMMAWWHVRWQQNGLVRMYMHSNKVGL